MFEYCIVVESQHNYTDSLEVAREEYEEELKAWVQSGKAYRKPELIFREEGTGNWRDVV